ncbi:hypothetical protein PC113_g9192 [Phytophthora cactorum]|uniref:Uncharacterized protein n=1 Tax=Phytophthora cactorum TaxID=29920 RepID=A0A8T0ZAA5_9STRA|nr:hypothetical protein PC113_g9192 [Phytophthora cactorum]
MVDAAESDFCRESDSFAGVVRETVESDEAGIVRLTAESSERVESDDAGMRETGENETTEKDDPRNIENEGSKKKRKLERLQGIVHAVLAGVVFSIVLCPVMIGFAAMIFSHPDFSETLPMLTKLVFASSTMHQLVITSLSPGTRLSPDYGPRAQAVVALERQRPWTMARVQQLHDGEQTGGRKGHSSG